MSIWPLARIGIRAENPRFLDFLRAGRRQVVEKNDPARRLEIGELLSCMLEQLLRRRLRRLDPLHQHDAGHNLFLAELVLDRNDGDLRDILMSLQHGVNLGGTSLSGMVNNRKTFGIGLPGVVHLRQIRDLREKGLELALDGYACHVFLAFEEVSDAGAAGWAELALRQGLAGMPDAHVALRRMRDELGFEDVIKAYGLTESCGTVTACQLGDDPETIANSDGRPLPDTEVICVDLARVGVAQPDKVLFDDISLTISNPSQLGSEYSVISLASASTSNTLQRSSIK